LLKNEIKEIIQALKEESIRSDNYIQSKQIEKAITQRCLDFKDNQKRMISSLTDNPKKSVNIDRIMIEKGNNNDNFISTNPTTIKDQVEEYYQQAFKKRNSNFHQLSDKWKKQYEPKKYIDGK